MQICFCCVALHPYCIPNPDKWQFVPVFRLARSPSASPSASIFGHTQDAKDWPGIGPRPHSARVCQANRGSS